MPGFQYEPYENRSLGAILDLMTRGDHARAEALRAGGAARARAAEIGGQNAAQLAGTLGGIAQGVGNQIIQYQQDAPRREMEQLQLGAAKDAAKARDVEKAITVRLTQLFSDPERPPSPQAIISAVGPERGTKIIEGLTALQTENQKHYASTQELVKHVLGGMDALPEEMRAQVYPGVRNNLISRGLITEEDAPVRYDSAWFQQARNFGKEAPKTPEPFTLNPGDVRFDAAGKPIASVPATPPKPPAPPNAGSFEDYLLRYAKERSLAPEQLSTKDVEKARKAYQQADDRPSATVTVNAQGANDVKEAVAGMKDGTIPPILPGRASKEYTAMMAEAHRQGYDLAKAAADWTATQKHFATLNGAQQTRIRQAVDTAYHSLDVIDTLADKWKGGRFPLLNAANLKLAKGGAFGKEAQSVATQLDAQISDLTSELGNVYMGGNSPTDHALTLAAKNLNAAWSNDVLKDMTKLARTNLEMRRNAINNVEAITPTSQAQQPRNETTVTMPAGKIIVTAPDGSKHPFETQAQADAFKRLAGIK